MTLRITIENSNPPMHFLHRGLRIGMGALLVALILIKVL